MEAQEIRTADELMRSGYKPLTPQESLSHEVKGRLLALRKKGHSMDEAMALLFPYTVVDPGTLSNLVSALIAGSHVLLFGPSGTGKTSLAKDIWQLFPKEVYVVEGCPVQDDPASVVDKTFHKRVKCCPSCQARFGDGAEFDPSRVDPRKVPVSRVRLREGFGLARLQGSSEVFPDNLTGVYNLHKLQELGDPTSPLILEPGKLLQANRGLLLVDEVGKLPLGTQNVLLQALQEGIVSPAKSRETFPGSFVAVTTSNLRDLDSINEPLNDRLSSIYFDYIKDHMRNRSIIEVSPGAKVEGAHFPEVLLHAGVYLVEAWRDLAVDVPELSEVGSNRTILDTVSRSLAFAFLSGEGSVSRNSFERGVREAMYGRIRARGGDSFLRNEEIVREFLEGNLPLAVERGFRTYWCTFFHKELGSSAARGEKVARAIAAGTLTGGGDMELFRSFVIRMERHRGKLGDDELIRSVAALMNTMQDFGCKEA